MGYGFAVCTGHWVDRDEMDLMRVVSPSVEEDMHGEQVVVAYGMNSDAHDRSKRF